MGHEYPKREILGVQRRAKPTPQRPRHSDGHGKGFGRWIEHQCDDLGSWSQERLGLLCIRNGGLSVGLSIGSRYLSPHRGLAGFTRSRISRNRRTGICSTAAARSEPSRSSLVWWNTLAWDSGL